MQKMVRTRIILLAFVCLMGTSFPLAAGDKAKGWRQLFNGKDLSGWDTWLTVPPGGKEPVGLNNDPKMVYTVVEEDGKPAVRISGEIFGALTTKEEFEDYHFKLEFKWGEKKWPPREKAVRDSGLLYHCVGKHGGQNGRGPWMESLEIQIQEKDCGDFYSVGGRVFVDVEGERKGDKGPITYKKGGTKFTSVNSRIIRDVDHEKKHGQWNTIEIFVVGDTCVHVVNGKTNMIMTNPRWKVGGKDIPLTRGKLQIQSEGAEVFYRGMAIRPLREIPVEYLK
jgi:hypothetical protein